MRIALLTLCFVLCASVAPASVLEAEQAVARQDYIAARKLLEEPAKNGDAAAQDMLGHMLLFGRGGAVDADRGAELLRQAADKGRSEAQNSMGVIYMTGVTGDLNPTEGINWFRKAAQGGHSYAMFNLGRAAEQGLGMTKSLDEAKRWYKQSAEKGNEAARQRLDEMEESAKTAASQSVGKRGGSLSKSGDYTPQLPSAHRGTDKTPLPLRYRLNQAPVHASGLEVGSIRLAPSKDRVEIILLNLSGERRTGDVAAFVVKQDESRDNVPLTDGDLGFSLRNQVTKRFAIDPALLEGAKTLVIEVRAEGQPVLEAKRELKN